MRTRTYVAGLFTIFIFTGTLRPLTSQNYFGFDTYLIMFLCFMMLSNAINEVH